MCAEKRTGERVRENQGPSSHSQLLTYRMCVGECWEMNLQSRQASEYMETCV